MVLALIRKVYRFLPPNIKHVCDNQYEVTATWKDENISVFDNTKPDTDVAKVARNSITDLQSYSKNKAYWVEGQEVKR
jgi:hypothetical protein